MKNPVLSIIIVKFKADDYLKKCINSINKSLQSTDYGLLKKTTDHRQRSTVDGRQSTVDKTNTEIIIVDNDKENLGFAAGGNKGLKKAQGKYLLFLNPDTIVLNKSLEKMVEFMENNLPVGILGPKIYLDNNKKEKQLSFCRFPDPLTSLFVYSPIKNFWKDNPVWKRFIIFDKLKSEDPFEVDSVAGAALMIRKNIFEKVGGFDENFFLYFEENDLCKRVQKKGFKIYFLPMAEIIHYGGKSTKNINFANENFKKSRKYFFRKYYGIILGSILSFFNLILDKISELK